MLVSTSRNTSVPERVGSMWCVLVSLLNLSFVRNKCDNRRQRFAEKLVTTAPLKDDKTLKMLKIQMQERLGIVDEEKASLESDSRNVDVPVHHEAAAGSNVINRLIRTTLITSIDLSGLVQYIAIVYFIGACQLLRSCTSTHCFEARLQLHSTRRRAVKWRPRPETAT